MKTITVTTLLLLFVALIGCSSSNPGDIEAFLKPSEADVIAGRYILQPPDEVEVHCSGIPELHLQRQKIRPDGKISFESLGEFAVAGKTPQQAAEILQQKAEHLYTLSTGEPIEVRVVSSESKFYYVLGQVLLPGAKVCTGRDTVLTALADAQPTALGWVQHIKVIRPSCEPDTRPRIFELNLDDVTIRGDTSKNVLLQDCDIVYVPPTILSGVAMKVEELVRPIGRAFSTVNIVSGPPAR